MNKTIPITAHCEGCDKSIPYEEAVYSSKTKTFWCRKCLYGPVKAVNPTKEVETGAQFCPMNSECRGDNQLALIEEYDVGTCDLDHEKCHYETCSIFHNIKPNQAGNPK